MRISELINPVVEADMFLLDYKIIIFASIMMIITFIIAWKKTSLRKISLMYGATNFIVLFTYIINRIYDTNQGSGYYYTFGTSGISDFINFVVSGLILFLIMFIGDKVVNRFKGGK